MTEDRRVAGETREPVFGPGIWDCGWFGIWLNWREIKREKAKLKWEIGEMCAKKTEKLS